MESFATDLQTSETTLVPEAEGMSGGQKLAIAGGLLLLGGLGYWWYRKRKAAKNAKAD